jgi:putative FmdB family regulatory protein
MPTYQYACTNAECGHRFERVQSFTDAAVSDCPQCTERVRKVYGSVGVVFKGSGFYRTDSRDSKASADSPKSDSSDSSSSTKSSDSSSKGTATVGAGSGSGSGSGSDSGSGSGSGSAAKPKAAAATT